MLNLYDGTPTLDNLEDIKYINRLLQQLVYTQYNFHKRATHYDYQADECHVSEDWTVIAPRTLIKNTVKNDMLTKDACRVTIELLEDHVLFITINLNPADDIEYTITPINRKQLDKVGMYYPTKDEEDTESIFLSKYEEVIR